MAKKPEKPIEEIRVKNPAAVALGKLGGAKGGKARAEKLSAAERRRIAMMGVRARLANSTPEQRSERARKAIAARWKKAKDAKK